MSVELHTDDGAARPSGARGTAASGTSSRGTSWEVELPRDLRRPNVSGDLPTVFQAAPMFRRTLAGYDRFQVDTYVRWAEDELATADREREHLLARHLRTQAALEESRQLLSHSSGGGEFLQLSQRLGSMLAAAADQAESMRAEAEADRCAAAAQAQRTAAQAERLLADAEAGAERLVAAAAAAAEELTATAARIVDDAEQESGEARAEAEARLAEVRAMEQRAAEHARQIRQQAEAEAAVVRRRAAEEVSAARLEARAEVVAMLGNGREERRRADAEAAAARERLDRDAATRSAALLAEVAALEHRRSLLRAEIERLAEPVADPAGGRPAVPVRLLGRLGRLGWRARSLRAP